MKLSGSNAEGVTVSLRPKPRLRWSLVALPPLAALGLLAGMAWTAKPTESYRSWCGRSSDGVCEGVHDPEASALRGISWFQGAPPELDWSDPAMDEVNLTVMRDWGGSAWWDPQPEPCTIGPGRSPEERAAVASAVAGYDGFLRRLRRAHRATWRADRIAEQQAELVGLLPLALAVALAISALAMLAQWLWLSFGPMFAVRLRFGVRGVDVDQVHFDPDELIDVALEGDHLVFESEDRRVRTPALADAARAYELLRPALDRLLGTARERARSQEEARRARMLLDPLGPR